ncbi:hypothetical protein LUZ61_012659 [Rhynchospora tenuis]|uniref:Serine/threonine-protein phosphatase n=1 Tax=Rhynchospora tenuis TaxID=198213 RepID=A0AAD6F1H1_9POAL|nr:hypothetical protein LUZ61_012659 [Rhynchospora tenuis]
MGRGCGSLCRVVLLFCPSDLNPRAREKLKGKSLSSALPGPCPLSARFSLRNKNKLVPLTLTIAFASRNSGDPTEVEGVDAYKLLQLRLDVAWYSISGDSLRTRNTIMESESGAASPDVVQPNLIELEAPIKICGDIHGQYSDLLRLFEYGGCPPEVNYLFLGDYVDRGKQSIETICLLLAYKIKYPENFFLLRGNHECASINRIYGFFDECKRRYNVRIWKVRVWYFYSLAVEIKNWILDETLTSSTDMRMSPRTTDIIKPGPDIRRIERPIDVPDNDLLCDLLWSDPDKDIDGWGENDRGVQYTFGPDRVEEFLQTHDLDLICRAHQVVEDGCEFFANRQLVTIFSAPNYCGEFDNAGAMMSVDDSLTCSFQIIKPSDKKGKFGMGIGMMNPGTPPRKGGKG